MAVFVRASEYQFDDGRFFSRITSSIVELYLRKEFPKHDSDNISLKRSFLGDNLTILVCLISKTHEIVAKKAIELVKI